MAVRGVEKAKQRLIDEKTAATTVRRWTTMKEEAEARACRALTPKSIGHCVMPPP